MRFKQQGKTHNQQNNDWIKWFFAFAERKQKILFLFLFANIIIVSIVRPMGRIVMGMQYNQLRQLDKTKNIIQTTIPFIKYATYLYLFNFTNSWFMNIISLYLADSLGLKYKINYLQAIFNQQIAWFDKTNQSQIVTQFTINSLRYKNFVTDTFVMFMRCLLISLSSTILSLIIGWKLSLVMFCLIPLIVFGTYLFTKMIQQNQKKLKQKFTQAGGKAQQAIINIKTVKSLNGQDHQIQKFKSILQLDQNTLIKYFALSSFAFGLVHFIVILTYTLGFWYGTRLIIQNQPSYFGVYSIGQVFAIVTMILYSGQNIGFIGPTLKKFTEGKQAARQIFKLIERIPKVQLNKNIKILQGFVGKIKFQNVYFSYPNSSQIIILDNLSIQFEVNKINAIVGDSGCGKSTIIQLLLRFYNPNQGKITLDGINIKELDISWLRSIIGYVSQQPFLFSTSIKQNLSMMKPDATDFQIDYVLKQAEIYDFIQQLEDKQMTSVGTGGAQLSGGQKQRIAIARALLKKPLILILDEATSALDRNNERLIKQKLIKMSKDVTIITIAHSIESIKRSQIIFVIQDGKVKQKGIFNELNRYKQISLETGNNFETEDERQYLKKFKNKSKQQKKIDVQINKQQQNQQSLQSQKQKKRQLQPQNQNLCNKIYSYLTSNIYLITLGAVFSIANGAIWPLVSYFTSRLLTFAINRILTTKQSQSQINTYTIYMLLLGIFTFILSYFQHITFIIVSIRLSKMFRIDCYTKILNMPISWFEEKKNKPGILTSRLAKDCENINGLTSGLIGICIQAFSCLMVSICLCFYLSWKMVLVSLCLIPILVLGQIVRLRVIAGMKRQNGQNINLISQCCINIRTVYGLNIKEYMVEEYRKSLENENVLKIVVKGFFLSFTQGLISIIFCSLTFIAVYFSVTYHTNIQNQIPVILIITNLAKILAQILQFFPDIQQSKNSAKQIFQLLDSRDQLQLAYQIDRTCVKPNQIRGHIKFDHVYFKYPQRKNMVIQDLSFQIKQGQKVAFVGHSGCGKSTIIQLLLRFYQKTSGNIYIDGIQLQKYHIRHLRNIFGVVSQQPVVFNTSILKNILYNTENITLRKIKEIIIKVNLSFIKNHQNISENLQDFQSQNVGLKGSHISGGQKQRVAIARALLRNPKILLLDEVSSALDQQNQKLVEDWLKIIMKGCTSIIVSHKQESIKDSDKIYVLQNGRLLQSGKFCQLKMYNKGNLEDI